MNKLSPFEDSLNKQLSELPVPAEEQAWEEMNKLLNKNDDDGAIIPPPVKTGCRPMSVLLILLLAGIGLTAVYFTDPWNWFNQKDKSPVENRNKEISVSPVKTSDPSQIDVEGSINNENATAVKKDNPVSVSPTAHSSDVVTVARTRSTEHQNDQITGTDHNGENIKPESTQNKTSGNPANTRTKTQTAGVFPSINKNKNSEDRNGTANNSRRSKKTKRTGSESKMQTIAGESESGMDAVSVNDTHSENVIQSEKDNKTQSGSESKDSSADLVTKTDIKTPVQPADSTNIKNDSSLVKKKENPKKKIHFSAGVAVYQGIPLNGAVDYAVNQSGKKNAVTDYIPSVYFRINKEDKWFIQSEVRYGVPQYSNGFLYKKTTQTDANQNTTTSLYKLHRTYYFQVPVSFNYYILPGWSVGTGLIYNKFSGALSTETKEYSNARMVNDSLISFRVVKDNNDSSFVKNSFQWQVESQYKWKQFSVGLRYSQGLQPYIKYTDPVSDAVIKAKYQSLNVFLRYELWKSRKPLKTVR